MQLKMNFLGLENSSFSFPQRAAFSTLSSIIILITLAAWLTSLIVMEGMDNGPGTPLHTFSTYLTGWVIMLTAMMLPSELTYIKVYAQLIKNTFLRSQLKRNVTLYSILFISGYGIAWLMYGTVAFAIDATLRASSLDFLRWDQAGPLLSGGIFLIAACYQISPLKASCLIHCQNPISFFAQHWRLDKIGTVYMGFRHGVVCVLCCWALMAVMFAVGAMNLFWMGILTIVMFAEKILPFGRKLTVPIAILLTIMGVWVMFFPDTAPLLTIPDLHTQENHHH